MPTTADVNAEVRQVLGAHARLPVDVNALDRLPI